VANTYAEFCAGVYKLYPGSADERKFSIADMDALVAEQLQLGIYDATQLGSYYRTFFSITQFLLTKNRLSTAKQSRAFVRGFQPELWSRIARRLELKFPDHFPDDPYTLPQIHEAVQFVLHGTVPATFNLRSVTATTTTASSSGHATSSVKPEDFSSILDKFATTLIKAISSSQPSTLQPPRNNNQGPMNPSRDYPANVCIFCGLSDYYINSCLVCAQYITDGKCKRNQDNKIVLLNGMFVPRAIPGIWIKERIDEWHRRNTPVATAAQMFYGVTTASAPLHAVAHQVMTLNIVPGNISDESRIAELKRELFALRSGRNLTPGIIRRPIEEPSTNDTSN
jgi:hypothetical protein